MIDQPNLALDFDQQATEERPAPYQAHSETSRQAAQEIEPKAGTLRKAVLDYLRAKPEGATDEQIQEVLNMPQNTERPRRRELQQSGKVCDSGRKSQTRSGRSAVVWVTRENFEPVRSSVPPCGANCA